MLKNVWLLLIVVCGSWANDSGICHQNTPCLKSKGSLVIRIWTCLFIEISGSQTKFIFEIVPSFLTQNRCLE